MPERKIKKIEYSPRFLRSFVKLPVGLQQRVRGQENIFKANAFDIRLKTHKLQGPRAGEWSYSVDYEYRIVFAFRDREEVIYFDIGTHDELYR
ncbi:MAG: type II toxin-antitoxin system mRNA interferase toxin, RelE/StbE family [Candidatus Sungbacteria bacterium]|nr:type II toxin-antitoxin system mRNA interferase toxin, RelE/StbE family [Candidatus Sungbacteria bacterium]